MAGYKLKIIALTKKPGQTFGFFLRVEHGEEGHLIRCLELGGPAELAGLKDGDRILRVNGTYVDGLTHPMVVDMIRNSGPSVNFHILDAASYKQAKAEGVDLSSPSPKPVVNGVAGPTPKAKLCYLVKRSESGFQFSLRSIKDEMGVFISDVTPGGVAEKAGVRNKDRLVCVNGENVENKTHDYIVEKIKEGDKRIMFLLVDEEADKFCRSKGIRIDVAFATTKHLPHVPRVAELRRGSEGLGFVLQVDPRMKGHYITDIDRGSPAERGGLENMDRLVAVDGQEVDDLSHDQVVDKLRQSSNKLCLLVVDADTDKMYKMGGASPMLFWEEMKDTLLPPSYPEAIHMPTVVRSVTPVDKREEELRPKLCKMVKRSAGFGFHLNGIEGVHGQFIKDVVQGGAAEEAGLEEDDIVVEVNGVNVEKSTHGEAVALIRSSGNSLELLVATKSVYNQLKAKGVAITPRLLGMVSSVEVHTPATLEQVKEETEEDTRAESPPVPASAARSESPPVPASPPRSESPPVPASPARSESTPVPASAARSESPPVPASPARSESPPVPASTARSESPPVPASPARSESPPVPASPARSESPPVPASPPRSESPPVPASPPRSESPPVPASPPKAESPPVPASPPKAESPPVAARERTPSVSSAASHGSYDERL